MSLDADTLILTTGSWQSLSVAASPPRSEIILPYNGEPTIKFSPSWKKEQDAYRVTFSDGSSAVCSEDHAWVVNTPTRRARKQPWMNRSTAELIGAGMRDKNGNRKWFVPIVTPPKTISSTLPVHPYLLGYLLGNGGLSGSSPGCTIPDPETVGRIAMLLPEGVFCKPTSNPINYRLTSDDEGECANPLLDALELLGLMGHTAEHKRVPAIYMHASPSDREECLQGLMDSDGCPSNNVLEFGSSSEGLRDDVIALANSLGGIGTRRAPEPQSYVNPAGERVTCLDRHRTVLALPPGAKPFVLSRKAGQYTGRKKYPPSRSIESIELLGEQRAMIDIGPVVAEGYVVA